MKKIIAILLFTVLTLSLTGCENKEETELRAEQVQNIILNYFSTDGKDDSNYVSCEADAEKKHCDSSAERHQ